MFEIDNVDLKKVYYIKKQTIVYKSSCFVCVVYKLFFENNIFKNQIENNNRFLFSF